MENFHISRLSGWMLAELVMAWCREGPHNLIHRKIIISQDYV